ncbi:hypothetical protein [Cupriavidus sp. CuC1]|uniref:hypothetical protein n=1 Tax=Cupriavidus sp. CuC1 TaxID=3373131 RepID=UPI0037D0BF3D
MAEKSTEKLPKVIRLRDLAWLLNDINSDLVAAVAVYQTIFRDIDDHQARRMYGETRLCLNAIIINLCRLIDATRVYGREIKENITEDVRGRLNAITRRLDDGNYYRYRSAYLAHPISRDTGRPLLLVEAKSALKIILGNESESPRKMMDLYCDWIHKPGTDCVADTLYRCIREIESQTGPLGHRGEHT